MNFTAALFDLDGTLIDSLADIANAMNQVLTARGFPPHPTESYKRLVGEGAKTLARKCLPADRVNDALVEEVYQAYLAQYASAWNIHTKVYPGIPQLLNSLLQQGMKLAVLSNKTESFTVQCVKEFLPRWHFGMVVGARDGLPRKPNPAGALLISRELGVEPPQCLFIGDSGIDIQTANSAKMYSIGVAWGFRGPEELQDAGAKRIVKEPLEIANCREWL